MTFLDRTTKAKRFRHWPGNVEADYLYTTGVAGERFFTELRDHGRILAAECRTCERRYLPPRMYCERCLGPLEEWSPVEGPAIVEAVTVTHVNDHGEPLEKPQVWGILRWTGIHGGLVHRLALPPDDAKPGLRVTPVLRPAAERVGNITDILHFIP